MAFIRLNFYLGALTITKKLNDFVNVFIATDQPDIVTSLVWQVFADQKILFKKITENKIERF